MNTAQTYLNLITSEHQNQPNFSAMVSFGVATMVQVQALMAQMSGPLFDLSTPPVGNQLDIIGQWAGVSRNVNIPITGILFTWDGITADGWGFGVWSSAENPSSITVLPDGAYLSLILAKIAANQWNGTTEGAYAVWAVAFPQYNLLIQDNQNMSFAIAIQGMPLDSLTLALLTGGYIPLRPEGVEITEYIVPVDTNPLFGWDLDTTFVQGWGTGSWGAEYPPT